MGRSDIIINVRVVPAASDNLEGLARYLGTREGAMTQVSEDDVRLSREIDLRALAGYYGERPGSVSAMDGGPCALFDLNGPVSVKDASKRFGSIRGNAVTMAISVRNIDAPTFLLESRESWQRLARSCLDRYAVESGIALPQNVRWVAAAHINAKSHHLHAVIWDASGRFDSLISKKKLMAANDGMRKVALSPALILAEKRKALLRDEMVGLFKIGAILTEEETIRIRQTLPVSGRTSMKHLERCCPATAKVLRGTVSRAMNSNPVLVEKQRAFSEAAATCARLKGCDKNGIRKSLDDAVCDLEKRCCNAAIATSKGCGLIPSTGAPAIDEPELGFRPAMPSACAVCQAHPHAVPGFPSPVPPSEQDSTRRDRRRRRRAMGFH